MAESNERRGRDPGPLRKVVSREHRADVLECGHIAFRPEGAGFPQRRRCLECAALSPDHGKEADR